jgi:hypothetical protein
MHDFYRAFFVYMVFYLYICIMKKEKYARLVELIGKEKADEVRESLIKYQEEVRLQDIKEHERLERMLNAMIPKQDMVGGQYYNGHRWRGKHVAMWDAEKKVFLTLNYTMGNFFIEELQHFEDVAETRIDGFIPFKQIKKIEVK